MHCKHQCRNSNARLRSCQCHYASRAGSVRPKNVRAWEGRLLIHGVEVIPLSHGGLGMSSAKHLKFASPEPQPLSSLGFVLQYIPPVPSRAAGFAPFDAADFLAMDATNLEIPVTSRSVRETPCKVILLSLHLFPALFPSCVIITEQYGVKTGR